MTLLCLPNVYTPGVVNFTCVMKTPGSIYTAIIGKPCRSGLVPSVQLVRKRALAHAAHPRSSTIFRVVLGKRSGSVLLPSDYTRDLLPTHVYQLTAIRFR